MLKNIIHQSDLTIIKTKITSKNLLSDIVQFLDILEKTYGLSTRPHPSIIQTFLKTTTEHQFVQDQLIFQITTSNVK